MYNSTSPSIRPHLRRVAGPRSNRYIRRLGYTAHPALATVRHSLQDDDLAATADTVRPRSVSRDTCTAASSAAAAVASGHGVQALALLVGVRAAGIRVAEEAEASA